MRGFYDITVLEGRPSDVNICFQILSLIYSLFYICCNLQYHSRHLQFKVKFMICASEVIIYIYIREV